MRIMKCVGLMSPVRVIGSRESVTIVGPTGAPGDADYHPGWQGDIDHVLGDTVLERDADGKAVRVEPFTIADGLKRELLEHFVIVGSAQEPSPQTDNRSAQAPIEE